MDNLANWTARPAPQKVVLEGRTCRLEPLSAAAHGDDLFVAATEGDAAARFAWLAILPPESRDAFQSWLDGAENHAESIYWAVICNETGRAVGRQSLMRIDAANGVVEVGDIHWGPAMQRTALATEALFLHAQYVFETLGYRRFEWKCNNENTPSKRAALRFGFEFEGLFRQHMVIKGANRDTAWYSMIDKEWPVMREAFGRWLAPDNFDSEGRQIARLEDIRETLRGRQAEG